MPKETVTIAYVNQPKEGKKMGSIKTENGKVAMFFSSPKRLDVLQSIKSAKSKQLKDTKPSKLSERTIRPEDVPGTLLNIAMIRKITPLQGGTYVAVMQSGAEHPVSRIRGRVLREQLLRL